MLHIVSATKQSNIQSFYDNTKLGNWIVKNNVPMGIHVEVDNTTGLSTVYNKHIKNIVVNNCYDEEDIIICCHDDVSIDDIYVEEKLNKYFDSYDILGLAGATDLVVKTPVLWHKSKYRYGCVQHTDGNSYWSTSYGPSPKRVLVIDGLFISFKIKTAKEHDLNFDEQFDFHFYDLDFSLQAYDKKLNVGVVPINVLHESKGDWRQNASWNDNETRFIKKWEKDDV